jgi:hypothetical protein
MYIMQYRKLVSALTAAVMTCTIAVSAVNTQAEDETGKIRVMPLGDSITDGYWMTGGYRLTLCDMLEENGLSDQVDFVGRICHR